MTDASMIDEVAPMIDEVTARRTTRRASLTMRIAESLASRIATKRTDRRSFLSTTAVVGSALALAPKRYLLEPVSAYAAVCGPASDCASGWTVFCCTINDGRNSCPPGTVAAGWWKADQNGFCAGGPRYYVDCNAECGSCGCGASGICSSSCWNCQCHCNDDPSTCDHRRVCCNEFRYGQCNQHLACVGPVVCRVVSCVAPWEWEPSCTTVSATANSTGLHTAPCLTSEMRDVYAFGAAQDEGSTRGPLNRPIVGFDATPSGDGYWLVASDGGVFAYGDARFYGSTGGMRLNRPVTDLAATPTGRGYWLVAIDGGIFSFGDARFYGSTGGLRLNRPVVGMAATPTGLGYWLVASDGGIFTFGDARFYGSTGGMRLNRPVVGMAATPTGLGYWLVTTDGGIFTFGDAAFHGSTGNRELRAPIVGMAPSPTGLGYLLVGRDGVVYPFGDARYRGGLASMHAEHGLAVDIEARPAGDGYWIATDRV
jgi:ribosomal protein S8